MLTKIFKGKETVGKFENKEMIPSIIKEIAEKLEKNGFQAYLVGGCVRDLLMKRKPKDWDFTTNARPEEIQKIFPKSFYENKFGTVTVITEASEETLKTVEITPFRLEGKYTDKRHPDEIKFAQTLEEDLARRDFTINALALKIGKKPEIIDLFGGKEDIQKKIIKTVGNPEERFNEDALRLLRAVRFACELNFKIEERTKEAIKKMAPLLNFISKERIRDEFIKIIMSKEAALGINYLKELNLLAHFLPELLEGEKIIGVTKKLKAHIKYESLTVFEHLLKTLDYAAKNDFNLETRLAALFHDIAKPRTKVGEGLEMSFKGHELIGAKMTLEILTRLRFPKKIIEKVALLVRWHFFFYDIDRVTEAGVRRLIRRVGPENINDLLKLREADRAGSGLPKISSYRLRHLAYMIEKVKRDPLEPKMLKVRGDEVMEILNIPPSPKVGWILNILLEEVIEDPKKNEREYLRERIKALGEKTDEELQNLVKEAKKKIEETEEALDQEMRRKFNV